MSITAWDIEALPGAQRHQGVARYLVRHNGVVTAGGAVIDGDRAVVIDMATGYNVTADLVTALLGQRSLRHVVSPERARVVCKIANNPAAHAQDIRSYRAKLAARTTA